MDKSPLTSIEICAGGGGQALGLEQAGFEHIALIDNDKASCQTLRTNRPHWNVCEMDLQDFDTRDFDGVDLLAGGVPCPPFSVAGKQLGSDDDRDLFPAALKLADELKPRAIMLENVRGFSEKKFAPYRAQIIGDLEGLGYRVGWKVVKASEYGVPQLRPRFILVAILSDYAPFFSWPTPPGCSITVGETLIDLMGQRGWQGAQEWADKANGIGPTIVGGSKKHGGPDLGPQRARKQWECLSVDGGSVAAEAPGLDHPAGKNPKLTVRMVARIQGFPDDWEFSGGRTQAYRQVGNALPPPVAFYVGREILKAIRKQVSDDSDSSGLEQLPLLRTQDREILAVGK